MTKSKKRRLVCVAIPQSNDLEPAGIGCERIDLDSTPITPAAHDAFTEVELDERIERMRVAAEEADPIRKTRSQCWACDSYCESGNLVASAGWYSRKLSGTYAAVREVYCPECFNQWGWGDAQR